MKHLHGRLLASLFVGLRGDDEVYDVDELMAASLRDVEGGISRGAH